MEVFSSHWLDGKMMDWLVVGGLDGGLVGTLRMHQWTWRWSCWCIGRRMSWSDDRMGPWILQPEESDVGASIRSKHGQVVMNSPSTSSLIEPGPTMANVPLVQRFYIVGLFIVTNCSKIKHSIIRINTENCWAVSTVNEREMQTHPIKARNLPAASRVLRSCRARRNVLRLSR